MKDVVHHGSALKATMSASPPPAEGGYGSERRGLGMSVLTATLLAACTTVEDDTIAGHEQLGGENTPATQRLSRKDRSPESLKALPTTTDSPPAKGSPNLLDAMGAALRRPLDTVAQALEPEKLAASAERGLSRAIIRQARRQLEEENAYRHPADQIEFDAIVSERIDPRDTSLAANYGDTTFVAESFAPLRPRFEGLGFIPLSDLAESKNPLRLDLRLPSGSHAQRVITGDESWRDFLDRFQYRASLELSAHGDTVSIAYDGQFVGVTFTHPIKPR